MAEQHRQVSSLAQVKKAKQEHRDKPVSIAELDSLYTSFVRVFLDSMKSSTERQYHLLRQALKSDYRRRCLCIYGLLQQTGTVEMGEFHSWLEEWDLPAALADALLAREYPQAQRMLQDLWFYLMADFSNLLFNLVQTQDKSILESVLNMFTRETEQPPVQISDPKTLALFLSHHKGPLSVASHFSQQDLSLILAQPHIQELVSSQGGIALYGLSLPLTCSPPSLARLVDDTNALLIDFYMNLDLAISLSQNLLSLLPHLKDFLFDCQIFSVLIYKQHQLDSSLSAFRALPAYSKFTATLSPGQNLASSLTYIKSLYDVYSDKPSYDCLLSQYLRENKTSIQQVSLLIQQHYLQPQGLFSSDAYVLGLLTEYLQQSALEDASYFHDSCQCLPLKDNSTLTAINQVVDFCRVLHKLGVTLRFKELFLIEEGHYRARQTLHLVSCLLDNFLKKRFKCSQLIIDNTLVNLHKMQNVVQMVNLLKKSYSGVLSYEEASLWESVLEVVLDNQRLPLVTSLALQYKLEKPVFCKSVLTHIRQTLSCSLEVGLVSDHISKCFDLLSDNHDSAVSAEKNRFSMAKYFHKTGVPLTYSDIKARPDQEKLFGAIQKTQEDKKGEPLDILHIIDTLDTSHIDRRDLHTKVADFAGLQLRQGHSSRFESVLKYFRQHDNHQAVRCAQVYLKECPALDADKREALNTFLLLKGDQIDMLQSAIREIQPSQVKTTLVIDNYFLLEATARKKEPLALRDSLYATYDLILSNFEKSLQRSLSPVLDELTHDLPLSLYLLYQEEELNLHEISFIFEQLIKSNLFNKRLACRCCLLLLQYRLEREKYFGREAFQVEKTAFAALELGRLREGELPLVKQYLSVLQLLDHQDLYVPHFDPRELKNFNRFIFDPDFRNQMLLRQVMEKGNLKLFESLKTVIDLKAFNLLEIYQYQLLAKINSQTSLSAELKDIMPKVHALLPESRATKFLEEVYSKTKCDDKSLCKFIEVMLAFQEVYGFEVDAMAVQCVKSAARVVDGSLDWKNLLSLDTLLTGRPCAVNAQSKAEFLRKVEQVLSESNELVLERVLSRLAGDLSLGQEVKRLFLVKSIKAQLLSGQELVGQLFIQKLMLQLDKKHLDTLMTQVGEMRVADREGLFQVDLYVEQLWHQIEGA